MGGSYGDYRGKSGNDQPQAANLNPNPNPNHHPTANPSPIPNPSVRPPRGSGCHESRAVAFHRSLLSVIASKPWDVLACVLFSFGSLLYVCTAVLTLLERYDVMYGSVLDLLAPMCDTLSAIVYLKLWYTQPHASSHAVCFDLGYLATVLFLFGAMSYLVEATLCFFELHWVGHMDIVSSTLLLVSAICGFTAAYRVWAQTNPEVLSNRCPRADPNLNTLPRINAAKANNQRPSLPRTDESKSELDCIPTPNGVTPRSEGIYCTLMAELVYVIGSVLYCAYSCVEYFPHLREKRVGAYLSMFAALLFSLDCYLYMCNVFKTEEVGESRLSDLKLLPSLNHAFKRNPNPNPNPNPPQMVTPLLQLKNKPGYYPRLKPCSRRSVVCG